MWRSIFELALTFLLFAACWWIAVFGTTRGNYLALIAVAPAAGLLLRLFIIQHDCGHGAFFARRQANDRVGSALGVLTMTPYLVWKRAHAVHHATSGNLDARGMGDIDTLTVREYRARSTWARFLYRVYRHPVIMFGVGPVYLFVLRHRLPVGQMKAGWGPWKSAMATNLAIAGALVGLSFVFGLATVMSVHLAIVILAASGGVWMFYVQHQFEGTHWASKDDWSFHEASLYGSSYYALHPIFHWFTGNIGLHHIHHLASRIPFYRLPEVMRAFPALRETGKIGVWHSLKSVRLTLWDEANRSLVSFRDAKALAD
ncbi:fatty acid desaturase [Qipengyuania seohaensis]|uniref:fatty acid desaturase n=1 Tax=Qipengyuania seohaensis TaxID=266951 RepID=UPI0018E24E35|nr:fatty acid desaturase [Qipengyuania seohaensis]